MRLKVVTFMHWQGTDIGCAMTTCLGAQSQTEEAASVTDLFWASISSAANSRACCQQRPKCRFSVQKKRQQILSARRQSFSVTP